MILESGALMRWWWELRGNGVPRQAQQVDGAQVSVEGPIH